jgi:hypothetical protein
MTSLNAKRTSVSENGDVHYTIYADGVMVGRAYYDATANKARAGWSGLLTEEFDTMTAALAHFRTVYEADPVVFRDSFITYHKSGIARRDIGDSIRWEMVTFRYSVNGTYAIPEGCKGYEKKFCHSVNLSGDLPLMVFAPKYGEVPGFYVAECPMLLEDGGKIIERELYYNSRVDETIKAAA